MIFRKGELVTFVGDFEFSGKNFRGRSGRVMESKAGDGNASVNVDFGADWNMSGHGHWNCAFCQLSHACYRARQA